MNRQTNKRAIKNGEKIHIRIPTVYSAMLPAKMLVRLAAFFCRSPTRRLSACVITEPVDCNGLSKKIDGHLRFVLGQASWGTRSKMACYWSCQQKPDLRLLNQQPKWYDMVYEALKNAQSLAPLNPKCRSLPTSFVFVQVLCRRSSAWQLGSWRIGLRQRSQHSISPRETKQKTAIYSQETWPKVL